MDKIIIEYKQRHSYRERMLLWLLGAVIPIHAKLYRRRKKWQLSRGKMLQYDEGTLGNKLGQFLEKENLEPVDKVERHDAFHIIFSFSTALKDEAAMQFFLIGNGKVSPFTIGTALFAGMAMPDHWKEFYAQFKRGRTVRSIAYWDFQQLLSFSFLDVQDYIFNRPVNNDKMVTIINSFDRRSLRG